MFPITQASFIFGLILGSLWVVSLLVFRKICDNRKFLLTFEGAEPPLEWPDFLTSRALDIATDIVYYRKSLALQNSYPEFAKAIYIPDKEIRNYFWAKIPTLSLDGFSKIRESFQLLDIIVNKKLPFIVDGFTNHSVTISVYEHAEFFGVEGQRLLGRVEIRRASLETLTGIKPK
jgi:hypothetical protein